MTGPREMSAAEWAGRIEPGERLLWQGRPDGRVLWSEALSTEGAIGALLFLFPVVRGVIWLTRDGGPTGQVPVVEAVALLAGLWFTVGRLVFDAWRRRGTAYALTDRAAYVADRLPARTPARYPLRADKLAVEEAPFGLGDVWFAESQYRERASRDVRRATGSSIATISAPVGFRLIGEARMVHRLATEELARQKAEAEDALPDFPPAE
ncbi:hypothetical protein [Pseudoroseicyclus sp. CXY001]|uniref:hypothetical protein n=1 Tax=Pseudoroseicyclus sp. CXY001 TaxID=3242492 RepID=UPI0035710744